MLTSSILTDIDTKNERKAEPKAEILTNKLNQSVAGSVWRRVPSEKLRKEKKKTSIEKRLEQFYEKPIEQIGIIEEAEVDWNGPIGEEVW